MSYDIHVIALPHTQVTKEFNHCAYTSKVRKFVSMMAQNAYKVYLYAGDEFDGDFGVELVPCITRAEQDEFLGDEAWYQSGAIYNVDWDHTKPLWQTFIKRAIEALEVNVKPRDIVCLSTGYPYSEINEAMKAKGRMVVEYGIGYAGILPDTLHVFESYAWMHAVYGQLQGAAAADGRFYDAVIPNFFEVEDFPAEPTNPMEPYCVFMSRATTRKGYEIAVEATRRAGMPLVIAGGPGDPIEGEHVKHVGLVDTEARGELLAGAVATFMPTLYLEPFGGVAVESMLCGTPVISTDFGAFPELIEHGRDGFRCHTMAEFAQAVRDAPGLNRRAIRSRARKRFRTSTVAGEYGRYFSRLQSLWGAGFYES